MFSRTMSRIPVYVRILVGLLILLLLLPYLVEGRSSSLPPNFEETLERGGYEN